MTNILVNPCKEHFLYVLINPHLFLCQTIVKNIQINVKNGFVGESNKSDVNVVLYDVVVNWEFS